MNPVTAVDIVRRHNYRRLYQAVLLLAGFAAAARSAPPLEPLPAPLFSFDLDSPSVVDCFVDADAVLMLDAPHPATAFPGSSIGLGQTADELNAVSVANANVPLDASFAFLFSVDRESPGVAAPDPDLVAVGLPYNVLDQAFRGHAAGDQFMSTTLFSRGDARGRPLILPFNSKRSAICNGRLG